MDYYLGIDQGGTKSRAAVCAGNGEIIGRETGEASIFYLDDPENRSTAIALRLAEKILAAAGRSMADITAVCAGLTGADWDFEYPIHEARTREGLGVADVTVLNDCMIAMRAGSAAPNRAVICAGTGINVAARAAGGKEIIYGYYINPRLNAASSLGGMVFEAIADAEAGVGPPTALTGIVLGRAGYASVESLLIDLTTRKLRVDPKDFVVDLLAAANEGDGVAVEIVGGFAEGAAKYVEAALPRLGIADADVELVYSGGVFKNVGAVVTDRITAALSQKFPRMRFVNARYEPVCGTLLTLLDRRYGGEIPGEVAGRFERDCVRFGLIRE